MTESEKQQQNFIELKAALDDSSDKNRNLLIAFLVLQVYVFSATFSVTDLQLFLLDSNQSFSLFNFAIPMEGFFYVIPPVIFAFHFNLLLNLRQHAIKLNDWLHHSCFETQIHLNLMRPFIFNLREKTDFLNKTQQQQHQYSAAHIVSFLLFSVFPLAILTFVMWRLADLQDGILTGIHCIWVLVDIAALVYFWPKIIQPANTSSTPITLQQNKFLLMFIELIIVLTIIKAAYLIQALYTPHKLQLDNNRLLNLVVPRLAVTNVTLDKQDKDRINGKASNNKTGNNDNKKINQCHRHIQYQPIELAHRNFNLIDLTGSTICNVNFTSAQLKNAIFKDATFSGKFNLAKLNYAKIYYTKLQQGSSFIAADLSNSEIHQTIADNVDFTFATINHTNISGTSLVKSQFLQTTIKSSNILQSQLDHSELVGANLKDTHFKQTQLNHIDLRLVKGLDKQYFEQGNIQHCIIDYQSIPNSYNDIYTRVGEENWDIETAAAIWNNSKCCVLYAPVKKIAIVSLDNGNINNPKANLNVNQNSNQNNRQDNRQNLVKRLITANKLTNNNSLNLSNMGLTQINAEVFALTHLKHLDLSKNQIKELPAAISQLSQLQQLNLRHNKITTIPDTIGQLSQLQLLYLSFNGITTIPDTIGQLSQLQQLGLWSNKITNIPDTIGQLSQLRGLGLVANKITTIPNTIGQLSQLQQLGLAGNKITTLPDTIDQLSQLQQLILSINQITTIPDTIGQLSQLQRLDLNENQITTIPNTIDQLSQLQQLNLANNKITTIPNTIGQLSQLQLLDIGENNQLSQLPQSLLQLKNLKILCLYDTNITALPTELAALSNIVRFGMLCRK